jgi:hypothetical protein
LVGSATALPRSSEWRIVEQTIPRSERSISVLRHQPDHGLPRCRDRFSRAERGTVEAEAAAPPFPGVETGISVRWDA